MPDITMCLNTLCPKINQCKRSLDSGTKPSYMQSVAMFGLHEGECEYFIEVKRDDN